MATAETVLTVSSLVRSAVEIYRRIKEVPAQMKKLGKRMEKLSFYLSDLEAFVRHKTDDAFVKLFDGQRKHLGELLEDIRETTEKFKDLFHKWENDIGPNGFQFRFKTLTSAYYYLGSSQEKINDLMEEVQEQRGDIDSYLSYMGVKAVFQIGAGGANLSNARRTTQKKAATLAPNQASTSKAVNEPGKNKEANKASPSPSPAPPRKDYKVLFVDPTNVGRSAIAEALLQLMRATTIQAGGDWRVKTIHSAGFFVKAQSDCVDYINALDYSYQSFRLKLVDGAESPTPTAIDAVFDNKTSPYMFKKGIQDSITAKKSTGLKKNMFKTYDYLIVFTAREHDNMVKLRMAIRDKEGKAFIPRSKGRVLHLGSYLTLDGEPKDITDPAKNKDGTHSRDNWNWKVSQMKIALRGFLTQEMKWKQPRLKADIVDKQ